MGKPSAGAKRVRLEIEDGMLTNVPRGERRPSAGQWWAYFLFCWRVGRSGAKLRHLRTITAPTKRECNAELRRLIARPDVRLLSKRAASR